MERTTQLTVFRESDHPATPSWPVDAGHEGFVGDSFHRELCCLMVAAASEASVRPFDSRTLATGRAVHTCGKAQGGLIGDHPRSFSQPFAALPTDLIVMEVGGSAARTKGHRFPSSLGNLLGCVGPDPTEVGQPQMAKRPKKSQMTFESQSRPTGPTRPGR